MARLNLKEISGERDSGRWISEIAAKVAYGDLDAIATGDPRSVGSSEVFGEFYSDSLRFDPSIPASEDQEVRANDAIVADGDVFVQFHFDRTIVVDETTTYRIVNVVIPDFTTKLVRDENGDAIVEDGVPTYDLTGVAEELFGYTTRLRCE